MSKVKSVPEFRFSGRVYQIDSGGELHGKWNYFIILGKDTELEKTLHWPGYFETKQLALESLNEVLQEYLKANKEAGAVYVKDLKTGVSKVL
jgi:hypothetical protein